MKKNLIRIATFSLSLLLIIPLVLSSCSKPDSELEINIYALSGTTALGMAKMMENAQNNADDMNYNITLYSDANIVTNAIVSGECDIAALPTNVAAKLYKKSEGKIQLLALNTLGVLYVLDTTNSIKSLSDLKGKTVYLPGSGSNPEYITAALLNGAGLTVGKDVFLDTESFGNPDALQAAIIAGKAPIAVMPEPKVSVVTTKNTNAKVAIDLTEEWEKLYGENTLVQGCLVVNKAFAEEHKAEIKKFLRDYDESVEYVASASDEAIATVVGQKILPSEPIAKKALPNCNICCITKNDMKEAISVFYEKLYELTPASIAAIPDDGFYYVKG